MNVKVVYCNLNNVTLTGIPLPIVFHNFSGYDSKLIMQKINNMKVSVIASLMEKVKCETIFIDSEGQKEDNTTAYANNDHRKKFSSSMKLILMDKKKYIFHCVNLRQAIHHGLKVVKVDGVIQLKEKAWLKSYIDFNKEKRKLAQSKFDKYFYRMRNNSVFGKTMENVCNHWKHHILTNGETSQV